MHRYNKAMHRRIFIGSAALAIAVVAAGWWLHRSTPVQLAATVLPAPRLLPEFTLIDAAGAAFRRADLTGRHSLIFFGYTHCPDVCPLALHMLGQVQAELRKQNAADAAQFIFVGVDAARDTPQRLTEFLHHVDGDFIGVGGSAAELHKLTGALGIHHAPNAEQPALIDHSGAVLLIDPQARLLGVYTPPQDPATIARDLLALARS